MSVSSIVYSRIFKNMHTDIIVIDTYLSGVTDAPRLTTL